MIQLITLIELANKIELTEQEERILILYFIYYKTGGILNGIFIGEVQTATINNKELWSKNVQIVKDYFKTIQV